MPAWQLWIPNVLFPFMVPTKFRCERRGGNTKTASSGRSNSWEWSFSALPCVIFLLGLSLVCRICLDGLGRVWRLTQFGWKLGRGLLMCIGRISFKERTTLMLALQAAWWTVFMQLKLVLQLIFIAWTETGMDPLSAYEQGSFGGGQTCTAAALAGPAANRGTPGSFCWNCNGSALYVGSRFGCRHGDSSEAEGSKWLGPLKQGTHPT